MNKLPLKTANYQALADFRYALRTFLAFRAHAASEVGLSPQAHQTLLAIKGARDHERLRIHEIAARRIIAPPSNLLIGQNVPDWLGRIRE